MLKKFKIWKSAGLLEIHVLYLVLELELSIIIFYYFYLFVINVISMMVRDMYS